MKVVEVKVIEEYKKRKEVSASFLDKDNEEYIALMREIALLDMLLLYGVDA